MANDADDFDKVIENLKSTVKTSFAHIYASLKARELKTLRQLDAIRKQCQDDSELMRNCVQNIRICYDNETNLLDNVSNFGAIDFKELNFDSRIFSLEDYVSPEDDHMYLYKTIEDLSKDDDLNAIEEAALKQITTTEDCVCFVNIRSEEVARRFRDVDIEPPKSPVNPPCEIEVVNNENEEVELECIECNSEEEKSNTSDLEVKKIDPTDDWLNSIKGQTETEPIQVADVMEHSTIACS
ncbi:hypothetical protein K1T71_004288 [Dendrolimus kikuchii]|uniref:Uncharacterized protein n=1 Tax=Dendrolimus kikuchii TaxID=765133 RepID=A0ACC1D812_9NEOP|nr:hypothetical protein K1T71_004288 [Dendrolimus kikuchii]